MILRRPGDFDETQRAATPSADDIINNIDCLLKKWRSELTDETVHELEKLQGHAHCLENVPVGCGTNRNERFHRDINAIFRKSTTISIHLALALLTTLFIKHNRSILGDTTPILSMPLSEVDNTFINPSNLIGFGLIKGSDEILMPCVKESIPCKSLDTIVKNVQNLIAVAVNLNLQSILYDPILVLICTTSGPLKAKKQNRSVSSEFLANLNHFKIYLSGEGFKSVDEALSHQFVSAINLTPCVKLINVLKQQGVEKLTEMLETFRTLQKKADFLMSVIIVLADNNNHPIHTVLPKKLETDRAIIICLTHQGFYPTGTLQQGSGEEIGCSSKSSRGCFCGKKHDNGKPSCKKRICPCMRKEMPCTKYCFCVRCGNEKGANVKVSNGCRCGKGAKLASTEPCCTNKNCQCFAAGSGCSESNGYVNNYSMQSFYQL